MSTDTDDTFLGAEYALGLLDGTERERAEARLAGDDAFAHEVEAWRARFAPLLDAVAPVEPPARVWRAIADAAAANAALDAPARAAPAAPRARERWYRRLAVWQGLTVGSGALALASLAGLILVSPGPDAARGGGQPLVASLAQAPGGRPFYVVTYTEGAALLAVPAGLTVPAGRVAELWVIPAPGQPGAGEPRAVGMLGDEPTRVALDASVVRLVRAGASLAVSAEPHGAALDRGPSGPLLASGVLAPTRGNP